MFPGSYTVSLNRSIQTGTVRSGEKETLIAGTITASGDGRVLFYVYDTDDNLLDFTSTNRKIELFPGNYKVKMGDTVYTGVVEAGLETVLP